MNVLVLNCGSSSLRFRVFDTDLPLMERQQDRLLARGHVERIGGQALLDLVVEGGMRLRGAQPLRDYQAALAYVLQWLVSGELSRVGVRDLADVAAVGHRVVHGGELFTKAVLIDERVLDGIEDTVDLAPLHNPNNIAGIRAARALLGPRVPQAAVFDTAFHATLPEEAFLYAVPYQYYRRYRLRRYGFHGTSFRYVAYRWRQLTGRSREQTDLIALHLGNGCSACAIRAGRSVDTSMGLTPLEGLVMGTRSGDVDPGVLAFLQEKEGLTLGELNATLNKSSGLLGLSGLTNDMRDLLAEEREHRDRRASLAIDAFCRRARKYLGAYYAVLGGAEAVVFTGGIGENSPEIRARICAGLECLGLSLDPRRNEKARGQEGEISRPRSRLKAYVIPANEELLIARDTVRLVRGVSLP